MSPSFELKVETSLHRKCSPDSSPAAASDGMNRYLRCGQQVALQATSHMAVMNRAAVANLKHAERSAGSGYSVTPD